MWNLHFLQCFKPKNTGLWMLVLQYCPACQMDKLGRQDPLIQMSLCKSIMWTWSLTLRKCLQHMAVGYSCGYVCCSGLGLCKLLSNSSWLIKALVEVERNLGSDSCSGECKMWNFIPSRDWEKSDPGRGTALGCGKYVHVVSQQAVKEPDPQYLGYECSDNGALNVYKK